MQSEFIIRHSTPLSPTDRKALSELNDFISRHTSLQVLCQSALSIPHTLIAGDLNPASIPSSVFKQMKRIDDDGYLIWPFHNRAVMLSGRTAKGLLNSVYGFQAWAGVQWPAPGVTLYPPAGSLPIPRKPLLRNAAFPRIGISHAVGNHDAYLEWYARLGFNEIMMGQTSDQWPATRQQAERLGMSLQTGGHGMAHLLPRTLFEKHPDYFRALQPPDFDRRRVADYNFCSGNPRVLDIVKKGVSRYVRQYPGASVYHLWADDLPAGGWCCCSRCMGLTPQDQAVIASNAMAEALTRIYPQARLAHVIYHDTYVSPRTVRPHPALVPLVAPRERCYAHTLNDPSCARNRWYREQLEKTLSWFGNRKWQLFEYYSDTILFRALLPLIPEIVAEDLKYYHSIGADCVQHLLVGTEVGLLTNLHVFAQQTWNLNADPQQPLSCMAANLPGLMKAWSLQASASRRWLKLCDWPMDRCLDYRFLLELPDSQSRAYGRELVRAENEIQRALSTLPAHLPEWAEPERLSLRTTLGIILQMQAQNAMLCALGRCAGGENRWNEAQRHYGQALRRGRDVGRLFRKAGMKKAYFFGLESMLESIWKDKITAAPIRPRD